MAESFGTDADRYDRARPEYPEALIARIVAASPGSDLLDVGCGTGIAARQFQRAGYAVLGVEPDPRMADLARAGGVPVEVVTFEDWQPAGRTFDTVAAAQSWHWVDPIAGAVKAASVLRPAGLLAIFGHVFEPPVDVAESFAAAFRKAAPDSPFSGQPARRPLELYRSMYANLAGKIRETEHFEEPEHTQYDWHCSYTRDQWLDFLPTTGGLTRLRPDQLTQILDAVGTTIDELGGHFTMDYTTLAMTATRTTNR